MGFKYDYEDIRTLVFNATGNTSSWNEKLNMLCGYINEFALDETFTGRGLIGAKNYMSQVHGTILMFISQMLIEYGSRLFLFAHGIYQYESKTTAVIPEELLVSAETYQDNLYTYFETIHTEIKTMVDEMANITGVTMPSFEVMGEAITAIKTEITNCKTGLNEYDTKWVTELADLEEYISTVKTIVEEYEGADGSNVTTYKNQSFFEKEIVKKAGQMFEASSKYVEDNQGRINLAVSYQMEVVNNIIDQASRDRESRGYQLIKDGIILVGGALIILATGGGGAPLVAAGFATISAGSCGVSNIYEGYQDVKYGRERDLTSQSYNIVRDELLFGDVESYEFLCKATDISLTTVNIWSGCNMISGSTGSMCTTGTKGVSIYISGEVAEECVGNFVMENLASLGVGSEWSMAAGFLSSAITGKVTPVTPTTRTYIDTTTPGIHNNVWNEPYARNYPETSYDFNLNRQYNIDSQYLRNTGTDGGAYNPIYNRIITGDAYSNSGKTVYTGADNNHTPETTYLKGLDNGDKKVYNGEGGSSSNSRYIPMDADGNPIPLNKQRVNGQDIPLPDPDAQGRPHTVLGSKISSKTGEIYLQSATFPSGTWPSVNGYDVPWSEVHWTDHDTPQHHTNPHQHIFIYNPDKGGWIRTEPTPYYPKGE